MNLSPSINLIWRLAAEETTAGEFNEIQPEHFCMALLKFAEAEIKAPETAGEEAELAKVIAQEVQLAREAIQKCGIESTRGRRKLRKQLGKGGSPHKGGKISRSPASRALFESAAKLAQESGSGMVTPLHLLTALVQSPTPVIAEVVFGKSLPPPPPALLPLLEKHGQDMVKQLGQAKIRVKPGLEAQSKVVLQALQQKGRKSILLVSDSDELVFDLAAALAGAMAAKNVPEGLKGRRLIDVGERSRLYTVKGDRLAYEDESELELMRQLLAEAAAHPEVILLVPAVEVRESSGSQWNRLLQETLVKGSVQLICRVTPQMFTEHLRKDPVWKRQTEAIWLEQVMQGSVPIEL